MSDEGRWIIRKIFIILGFIFLVIAITGGITIIILSFKFASGTWLVWWKYVLAMLGLAIASVIIAIIGIFLIYLAIDTKKDQNNGS